MQTATKAIAKETEPVQAEPVKIYPVRSSRQLSQFIRLPFKLYRENKYWVPPLISERKRFLNRRKNPFFKHAEAEYFLAELNGEIVGRIVACVDHQYEEFQGSSDGSFGFFESIDDPAVAGALVGKAKEWLRQRGRTKIIGPLDFSTNDECGLLVEGHDDAPYVLMPYHHDYYQALLEGEGFEKSMDLLQWQLISKELDFMPVLEELAKKALKEHNVTIRPIDMGNFEAELDRFFDLYNSAWERNWGFVPMTKDELNFAAKDLKTIIEPQVTLFAEREGEVLGGAFCLPNINEILPRLNGRLLPFGWLRFLRARRKIKTLRVLTLGVKHEYQHTGIAAALYIAIRNNGLAIGIESGEMGWILETNKAMNKAMEAMGGKVVKRYRIFEQPL